MVLNDEWGFFYDDENYLFFLLCDKVPRQKTTTAMNEDADFGVIRPRPAIPTEDFWSPASNTLLEPGPCH